MVWVLGLLGTLVFDCAVLVLRGNYVANQLPVIHTQVLPVVVRALFGALSDSPLPDIAMGIDCPRNREEG